MNNSDFPKTIFCDIDGVLLQHKQDMSRQHLDEPIVLPGAIEALKEWEKKGYSIILVTGRRESTRDATVEQLKKCGIFYDQLVMGIRRGSRVVVNDRKPSSHEDTAFAINVERNKGLSDIVI